MPPKRIAGQKYQVSKTAKTPLSAARSAAAAKASADQDALRSLRKDRKMQRTRRHLAEVAVRLFAAKGYAATTIDEIANAADYSTSTFFRMFADKEEVIFYDFGERLDELQAAFAKPNHGNVWVTIRTAFIEFARGWDNDGELAWQRAQLFHDEPILKFRYLAKNHEWEQAIANLVAKELGAGPDIDLASRLIAGAAVAAFRSAWQSQLVAKRIPLATCVEKAFDQLESIGPFFNTAPSAAKGTSPPSRRTSLRSSRAP